MYNEKLYVSSIIVLMAVCFSYCHTAKKAAAPATAAVTYETNRQPIIASSLLSLPYQPKGGNKEALDNYANVTKEIEVFCVAYN